VLALDLLKYAAQDEASSQACRVVAPLDEVDEREIQWIVEGGLGPLLYRATRDNVDRAPVTWRDALLSADLSAQVRHAGVIDTANEVIDLCRDIGTRVTLLKGISISDQYYPAAHLRPMGDIDILVPGDVRESVESALLLHDYRPRPDYEVVEGAHHGIPLCHPRTHVWVEIHTALFPETEDRYCGQLFKPAHVAAHSVDSTFHGRSVNRLSDELQLVYIAYSWMRDLTNHKIHPSFLASLFDAVYLLKASRATLDWNGLVDWLCGDMPVASLYVTLGYLARHGATQPAPSTLSRLASRQSIVGPLQLRLIHTMLDRYLIGGRPWQLVLPPPVPGRYSLRHQLRKRLGRR